MIELRMEGSFKAELGFVVARAEWRKGYATEAVRAVMDMAFSLANVCRVWAVCDIDNRASARVLEHVGMTREGVLARFEIHPNISKEPRDVMCYAKVPADPPSRRPVRLT